MKKNKLLIFVLILLLLLPVVLAANLNVCATLNASTSYTLTANLTSIGSSTCISMTENNIVLDGAGYTIRGDYNDSSFGFYITGMNNTVKNLYVTGFGSRNIFISGNNTIIDNVTIYANGTSTATLMGFQITGGSNLIANTTIIMNDSDYNNPIFESGANNYFKNMNINTNNTDRNILSSGTNTTLDGFDSTIQASTYNLLFTGGTHTIKNSKITGPSTTPITLEPNIRITNTSINYTKTDGYAYLIDKDNVYIDCMGKTIIGTGYGTAIYNNANNTIIKGCTISGFPSGINSVSAVKNVTIDCDSLTMTGTNASVTSGIWTGSNNTIIKNCNVTNYASGIYVSLSYYNSIDNSSAITTMTNSSGITLYFSNYTNITKSYGSSVSNSSAGSSDYSGILVYRGTNNRIEESTGISPNGEAYGISAWYTKNLIINKCNTTSIDIHESVFQIPSLLFYFVDDSIINNTYGEGGRWYKGGLAVYNSERNQIQNSYFICNQSPPEPHGEIRNGMAVQITYSNYNNLTNVTGWSIDEDGIGIIVDSHHNIIRNSYGSTNTSSGLLIFVNASYNEIYDSIGVSRGNSVAVGVSAGSHHNIISGVTGIANQGNSLVISSYDYTDGVEAVNTSYNNVTNSIFVTYSTSLDIYALAFKNNTFGNLIENVILISYNDSGVMFITENSYNNTIRKTSFTKNSQNGHELRITNESTGNIFCLNTFVQTYGVYINDSGSNNYYNCSYDGNNQGNLYANVLSGVVSVTGIDSSSLPGYFIGNNGSVPYNSVNSQGKVTLGVVDYAPLTPTREVNSVCQNSVNNAIIGVLITFFLIGILVFIGFSFYSGSFTTNSVVVLAVTIVIMVVFIGVLNSVIGNICLA